MQAARDAERLLRPVAAAEEIDGDWTVMPEHLESADVLDNEARRS